MYISSVTKSGRARISGHLGKIARITPGFLWLVYAQRIILSFWQTAQYRAKCALYHKSPGKITKIRALSGQFSLNARVSGRARIYPGDLVTLSWPIGHKVFNFSSSCCDRALLSRKDGCVLTLLKDLHTDCLLPNEKRKCWVEMYPKKSLIREGLKKTLANFRIYSKFWDPRYIDISKTRMIFDGGIAK